MTTALVLTWMPRGEEGRLVRFFPAIRALYHSVAVVVPPTADPAAVAALQTLDLEVVGQGEWASGRYVALRAGVATGADYLHYVDADRLVRWYERLPDELAQTVAHIPRADFTAIGRTPAAFATHPQALQLTEQLTNRVLSQWLGQPLDLASGSKGFSLAAARFILRNSQPIRPMGTDAEWAVLARRGGFSIASLEVDGLDWESADQYQTEAADRQRQQQVADAYDGRPDSWALRVRVANEVIEAGLDALTRPLLEV